jgi:hypothetical protein
MKETQLNKDVAGILLGAVLALLLFFLLLLSLR